MDELKKIGIVGGRGPQAGVDLVRKIHDQTKAECDQDHLSVYMLSSPSLIPDRSDFLLGRSPINPALAIARIVHELYSCGATVIGIPCNTAHADQIFLKLAKNLPKEIQIPHMIEELARYISTNFPAIRKVGVLSTAGTRASNVYPQYLSRFGLSAVQVADDFQRNHVCPAIYGQPDGIKSCSNPISHNSLRSIGLSISHLKSLGADAVVLGCSELSLALDNSQLEGVRIFDPSQILARTLVHLAAPSKLVH